jgi:hypothetical protein
MAQITRSCAWCENETEDVYCSPACEALALEDDQAADLARDLAADTATVAEGRGGEVCGLTFDHDEAVTYEDEEILQWECRRCGALGEVEKAPPASEGRPSVALEATCRG